MNYSLQPYAIQTIQNAQYLIQPPQQIQSQSGIIQANNYPHQQIFLQALPQQYLAGNLIPESAQNFRTTNQQLTSTGHIHHISPFVYSQNLNYIKLGAFPPMSAQQEQKIQFVQKIIPQASVQTPMIIQSQTIASSRNKSLADDQHFSQTTQFNDHPRDDPFRTDHHQFIPATQDKFYKLSNQNIIAQQIPIFSKQDQNPSLQNQSDQDLGLIFNDIISNLSDEDDFLRPLKFKLHTLSNKNLRYEVIYKNLLRDLRKFYLEDFNEFTQFPKKKKKFDHHLLIECLKLYVVEKNILDCAPFPGQLIGTTVDKIIFSLGSLIYPKEMIKYYLPEFQDEELKDIKTDSKDRPQKARKIINVYHYLYRFSLNRLNRFVNDPSMIKIFWYYFNQAGHRRIECSNTMRKYRDAYLEASENLKNFDYFNNIIKQSLKSTTTSLNNINNNNNTYSSLPLQIKLDNQMQNTQTQIINQQNLINSGYAMHQKNTRLFCGTSIKSSEVQRVDKNITQSQTLPQIQDVWTNSSQCQVQGGSSNLNSKQCPVAIIKPKCQEQTIILNGSQAPLTISTHNGGNDINNTNNHAYLPSSQTIYPQQLTSKCLQQHKDVNSLNQRI